MSKPRGHGQESQDAATKDLVARLRIGVTQSLDGWREVYESFSPRDVETGEHRPRVPPPGTDCRSAAVLIPVLLTPEGARLVYMVRKDHLHDHSGQISFPGGASEPGDESLLATALREAEEEIGLRPELVEVIGELEDLYIPSSRFLVKPFVGLLPNEAELVLSSGEVEAIFSVSLKELMSSKSFKKGTWERDGRQYEVPIFAVEGREIWGATAAMTGMLLVRLGWKGNAG